MSNYVGRHILLDCYGCNQNQVNSRDALISIIHEVAKTIHTPMNHIQEFGNDDEIIITGLVITPISALMPIQGLIM